MLEFEKQMARDTLIANAIGGAIGIAIIVGGIVYCWKWL